MGRPKNEAAKILGCIMLFISCACIDAEGYKMDREDALETLWNAARVESRLIGESGEKSKIYQAFSALSGRKDASDFFYKLCDNSASAAGKIYSLIWAFNNDKKIYSDCKKKILSKEKAVIEIRIADILYDFTLSEIFQKIENGELFLWLDMSDATTNTGPRKLSRTAGR